MILDVDGTLVDSNDAHARAWIDAFSEFGITVAYDAVRRSIGMGGDKLMPEVSGISESSELGQRISSRRGEIFRQRYLPAIAAFPRTRELIERFLADGLALAVASSAKEDELEPLLQRAGVADLVRQRTSSDDADESKPDPDIVLAALRHAGVNRQRAVMLGDTPYDVAAARRAGLEIVGLECGGWTREALAGAVAVYRDPAELLVRYDESPFAVLRAGARP
ncbi:MAG TPA: HAD family hydrolase [Vicinamibacterales bacterium]|nr:HAD family hydrolase [Vicinamibacterales bacterium]